MDFIDPTVCKLNKIQRTTRGILYHIMEHTISKTVLNTVPFKGTGNGSNFV